MNEIQKMFSQSSSPAEFSRKYLNHISQTLLKMDSEKIGQMISVFESARERGATVFFIGNGGSAATASHFANDIGVGTRTWDRPFRCMALTDNVATITALANDYGYDAVFEYQLKNLLRIGDVVVAITASGNSPNILKALEYSKSKGAYSVGLTGFDGGKAAQLVDLSIHVPTTKGEYGPVEDAHMVVDHLIGAYLSTKNAK